MFLPVIMIGITLCLYSIPFVPRKHLLLRICIAAIIGTHFVLEPVLNAHTEGGPGVGTIYMVGYMLLLIAIPVAIAVKTFLIK
jgi:hypothetical protein